MRPIFSHVRSVCQSLVTGVIVVVVDKMRNCVMRNAEGKMWKFNVEWWVKCLMRNGKGVTYFALCLALHGFKCSRRSTIGLCAGVAAGDSATHAIARVAEYPWLHLISIPEMAPL